MRGMTYLLGGVVALAALAASTLSAPVRADDAAAPVFGIRIPLGYRDWRLISVAHEAGNLNDFRAILGNDVAIQAIAENQIDPWPDGTEFAKVAWHQQQDEEGIIRPGTFFQVEFMIRDSQKYSATKGWGWARWRGTDLKPYGQNALFTRECVGCHNPLVKTNYVFTAPLRGQP